MNVAVRSYSSNRMEELAAIAIVPTEENSRGEGGPSLKPDFKYWLGS